MRPTSCSPRWTPPPASCTWATRRRAGAGRSVSLSDTVGFIRDLPHGLIDAFQATLQEATDADLLLHVVDAANPHHPEQIEEVQRVLHEIGADRGAAAAGVQQDRRARAVAAAALRSDHFEVEGVQVPRLFVSSRTGEGLAELRRELAERATQAAAAHIPPPSPELHDEPA
jgi:GTP-binding protein HflX